MGAAYSCGQLAGRGAIRIPISRMRTLEVEGARPVPEPAASHREAARTSAHAPPSGHGLETLWGPPFPHTAQTGARPGTVPRDLSTREAAAVSRAGLKDWPVLAKQGAGVRSAAPERSLSAHVPRRLEGGRLGRQGRRPPEARRSRRVPGPGAACGTRGAESPPLRRAPTAAPGGSRRKGQPARGPRGADGAARAPPEGQGEREEVSTELAPR